MVDIHAPYSSSHCSSLRLIAKRRSTQISPRLIDTISITGLLPPGRRTERKVRSQRDPALLLRTIPYTCASFSRSNPARLTAFELGVDQCARRFENGMSIRYALRSIKIDVKYNTLARGLLERVRL